MPKKGYVLTINLFEVPDEEAKLIPTIRQLAEIDNMDIDWEIFDMKPFTY